MSNSPAKFPLFSISRKPFTASLGLLVTRKCEIDPFTNRRENYVDVKVLKIEPNVTRNRTATTTDATPGFVVFTEGWLRPQVAGQEPQGDKDWVFLTPRQITNILVPSSENYDPNARVVFSVQEGITVHDIKSQRGLGRALLVGEIPVVEVKGEFTNDLMADKGFIEQPRSFASWLTGMTLDDMIVLRKTREQAKEDFYVGNAAA